MKADIKRTVFYNELDKDISNNYFGYSDKKFYENVDTFYYNVFIDNDDKSISSYLEGFFNELDILKENYKHDREVIQEFKGLQVMLGTYGQIYSYRLSEPERYDIFMSDYLPNKGTARIVVQLRSNALWMEDFHSLVSESFQKVKELFSEYKFGFNRVLENRIDYAFHTNLIQNPTDFFSDKNLNNSLETSLSIYHKVGNVIKQKVGDDNNGRLTIDYLSLGQRKSNCLFFRSYNKTREVIEQNYKSFFIEFWYKNKMISFYDKYCYEYAYLKKSYNAIDTARLKFYLEYGLNPYIKSDINELFRSASSTHEDIKYLADKICPKVTLILNIEYQTKRKFYYSFGESLNILPCSIQSELKRLFMIYENRKIFIDYLTSKTVAFVDKKKDDYRAFWKRLRGLKLKDCNKVDGEYLRQYGSNLDFNKIKKRFINTVATTSIYNDSSKSDFVEDLSSLLGCLNDNDMQKKFTFVDEDGVLVDYIKYIDDVEYFKYKEKRHKELKNKIRPPRQE